MDTEYASIAIVGHVDHGKSTLIGRLFYDTKSLPEGKIEEIRKTCNTLGKEFEFAYVTDYFQEEREQDMTIDTTQSFFKTAKRHYLIIDTPGHKEFTRNMITGASQAEAAILIVDVTRGMEEQTKRHAFLLSILGIDNIILAINKMDLIEYSQETFNKVRDSSTQFLSTLGIKPSYVIPISAKKGDNIAKKSDKINWYNGKTLLGGLDGLELKKEKARKGLRFPVQDVYKIKKKRIIVGRVENGEIHSGEEVVILPDKTKTKISSIEVFMEDRKKAEKGESIGITLENDKSVKRGDIICNKNNLPTTTDKFRADVFWMSERPFNIKEKVTLKIATEETEAVIEKIEKKINSSSLEEIKDDMNQLKETEAGVVYIKTSKPVLTDTFKQIPELGRFVLIRNKDIAAGGIII